VPNLFIIAGPNGAGKTAYARRFLPEEMRLQVFLNADLIAAGLSPFAPDQAAYDAGRLMLLRLRKLTDHREDFSFETTLSGRTYAPLLEKLRAAGYHICLDFLWIPELDVSRQRVLQRVSKGGHDIPESVQSRRFHLGLRNLAGIYRPLLHRWRLYDNTSADPHLVAEEVEGRIAVADAPLLARIEQIAGIRFVPDTQPDSIEEPGQFSSAENTRRSKRAMRKAFADVVLENLRYGLPVIQYLDGKVVKTPAEELAPLARHILAADGEPLSPEP